MYCAEPPGRRSRRHAVEAAGVLPMNRRAASFRARPPRTWDGLHGLPRRQLRPLSGRSALRWSANPARAEPRCCRPCSMQAPPQPAASATTCANRAWPTSPAVQRPHAAAGAHRLGLRAPARPRRPAHAGQRRRQHRRAPDGRGRAPLRQSARVAGAWLEKMEIDLARHRRRARHVLGRHAAAPADRAEPRHPSAPGLHGRADRLARRVGAGPPARPAAPTW